ncbi:FliH/SctL family protein [Sphingomonas elodea]|uniref:FliH/SctL family protein n=1 Tax=Sphingomonas elodea TaxID=179878 RepID=UPI0002631A92|nr:FliH/SctL family protein [Sphingomonas elodea]
MSIHVERFAFDRVFSAPASEKKLVDEDALIELAALRAEIALLKADQQAVIDKARAEGFEAGLAQARSEREVALLSAVDALHASIEVIDAQFTEIAERVTSEATEVALAAADHIAARAIERAPGDAIDAAIGRVLGQVARGTELQVRVHPDLVEDIEAKIADRQSRDRRKLSLTVAPDATLAMGDALINWDEGGLALNAQARRDAVAAELESLLLH